MRQDGGAEFISASLKLWYDDTKCGIAVRANTSFASGRALICLNTCELLNALRLDDAIRRGQNAHFLHLRH